MKKQQGFTLIELLVVIAIIGILSTLAVVSLNNARQKARDAKIVSDVKNIQTALELYYNDAQAYPTTLGSTTPLRYGSTTYIEKVPTTPQNTSYDYSATTTSAGIWTYLLTYTLEGNTGNITFGEHTASPGSIQ